MNQSSSSISASQAGGFLSAIQPKLTINQPGDVYEQEADQVAEQVMRMPEPMAFTGSSPPLQRKCAECASGQGTCPECAEEEKMVQRKPLFPRITPLMQRQVKSAPEEEEELLQTKAASGEIPSASPSVESHVNGMRGGGQPLPESERAFFEPRFGYDFSGVRVHADSKAAQSARAVNARAYTMGRDVVFGAGEYSPETAAGKSLVAHELTHVVQQGSENATLLSGRGGLRLARAILDLPRLDRELSAGGPLTQTQGEIGLGSARGRPGDAAKDDPGLPITAHVFQRTPPASSTGGSPTPSGSGGTPAPQQSPDAGAFSPDAGVPESQPDIRDAGVPIPAGVPLPEETEEPSPSPAPAPSPPPADRAVVVGGIHGDEGGARGRVVIAERLQTELTGGLQRDFDTIMIPVMNPGGLQDNTRDNRHGIDLNRNFPGLTGFPAGPSRIEQPETKAVREVIEILHPSRVLALHTIKSSQKGGVYADPVEGEARELACRMALRMQGTATASGAMSGEINVRGNRIAGGVCESRYPDTASVSVTTSQSSLGAWGSAPLAQGGRGTTVITHEISDPLIDPNNPRSGRTPVPAQGAGRSVDTMMPGIREFLLDNRRAPSEADDLLRRAVTNTFLSGQATTADATLRDTITEIVRRRFSDMAAFYKSVWFRTQPVATRQRLPAELTAPRHSQTRDFSRQAGIVTRELSGLGAGSTDPDIQREILRILQTRSLPGFSRHHWGTELDVLSAERPDWDPTIGKFRDVIPFLQTHAREFGFFHPYTAGYSGQAGFPNPSGRHYLEEPWHISYWPIANVLQQKWINRFTGSVLDNLITETARAIRGPIPEATMVRVLTGIGLASFQTNVAPSP